MMGKNIDAEKFVEENEGLRDQIRKLKQKRFQAKVLDFTIRASKLIYIGPVIIILSLFVYNKVIGAFISIAYFFIMSMLLEKLEKHSRVRKFMDEFSEANCKDRIQEIESRIELNSQNAEGDSKRSELR